MSAFTTTVNPYPIPAPPGPPPISPAFARYTLCTGPYAGSRLAVIAAADPVWLLATFANPTGDALDATAIREFVNLHPSLLAGETWVAGAGHMLIIAPAATAIGEVSVLYAPCWVERVAGEEVGRFLHLHGARCDGEECWGVRQRVRITSTRVLVGTTTRLPAT